MFESQQKMLEIFFETQCILVVDVIVLKLIVVLYFYKLLSWWLGSRVVSMLDLGAEGPGFKSQSRCCRVTVLGKLFTPIVPLFIKQQNW